MKYYEHYLKRLRESIARGPAAQQILPLLEVFDDYPPETRFLMIQQLERVLRDVDPAKVDWTSGLEFVRKAAGESKDPEEFGRRLREVASPG